MIAGRPDVSVLMPVYNGASYLIEAIDSILNQTFTNFEFIIIDDGSTDNSVEIVRNYSDTRINLYVNETNKGIVYTLNRGIDLSKAPLIARMDADDVSLPDRLEKQYDFLINHPDYSLVCSWINIIDREGRFERTQIRLNSYMYYDLIFKCVIPHPSVMFTKESILKIGKYQNVCAEDFELWSRYIELYKVFKLDIPLLSYRKSETSISNFTLRNENSDSTKEIVSRNIFNLTGIAKIDDSILECFMDNFEPLLTQRSLIKSIKCLIVLNKINRNILRKENPNKEVADLKGAIFYKKNLIIHSIISYFNIPGKIILLIATNSWYWLYLFAKKKVI